MAIAIVPVPNVYVWAAAQRELVTIRQGEIWEFRNLTNSVQRVTIDGADNASVDFLRYSATGAPVGSPGSTRRGGSHSQDNHAWANSHDIPAGGKLVFALNEGNILTAVGNPDALSVTRLQTPVFYTTVISEGGSAEFTNHSEHIVFFGWRALDGSRPGSRFAHERFDQNGNRTGGASGAGFSAHGLNAALPAGHRIVVSSSIGFGRVAVHGDFVTLSNQPYRITIDGQRSFPPGREQEQELSAPPAQTNPNSELITYDSIVVQFVCADTGEVVPGLFPTNMPLSFVIEFQHDWDRDFTATLSAQGYYRNLRFRWWTWVRDYGDWDDQWEYRYWEQPAVLLGSWRGLWQQLGYSSVPIAGFYSNFTQFPIPAGYELAGEITNIDFFTNGGDWPIWFTIPVRRIHGVAQPPQDPPPQVQSSIPAFTAPPSSTDAGVVLEFTTVPNNRFGYRIFRATSATGNGISITDFPIMVNPAHSLQRIITFDPNLRPNSDYWFYVREVIEEARFDIATATLTPEVLGEASARVHVRTSAAITESEVERGFVMMFIGNPYMNVNNVWEGIDPPSNITAPIINAGRTMVPIRAIVEAMGGTVGWDAGAQRVDLTSHGNHVQMWLGQRNVNVNGASDEMDVVPQMINNRTLIPLRFVAEFLGSQIEWIGSQQMVVIVYELQ